MLVRLLSEDVLVRYQHVLRVPWFAIAPKKGAPPDLFCSLRHGRHSNHVDAQVGQCLGLQLVVAYGSSVLPSSCPIQQVI